MRTVRWRFGDDRDRRWYLRGVIGMDPETGHLPSRRAGLSATCGPPSRHLGQRDRRSPRSRSRSWLASGQAPRSGPSGAAAERRSDLPPGVASVRGRASRRASNPEEERSSWTAGCAAPPQPRARHATPGPSAVRTISGSRRVSAGPRQAAGTMLGCLVLRHDRVEPEQWEGGLRVVRHVVGAAFRIESQSVVSQADAAGLGVVVHGVSLMRSTPLSTSHRPTPSNP